MADYPYVLIGDLINHAYLRARKAWETKNLEGYQKLARSQEEAGSSCLDVNIDGTQKIRISQEEMLAFLPELVPALQEATALPLCFDNPHLDYHRTALEHYDPSKSGPPIVNSVAASREQLDEMIELIRTFDTRVIVMSSEKFTPDGSAQCFSAAEVYQTARRFTEMLVEKADREPGQIIIDPGLAPVGADTYGLVNMGLDAMQMIRADEHMAGVHLSVGLTNFSFGVPKTIKSDLESAYITLALEQGLDFLLASPEKNHRVLDADDRTLQVVRKALDAGRVQGDESPMDAGFRQAETIMELFP